MTDSQETLMRILEATPLIIGDTHEQDRQFIDDGRALARDGLVKMGHDSNRGIYAIKITDAGRAALGDRPHE